MGCFGICTEEVLVSPLTFAGLGKTVSSWVNLCQSRILCDGNIYYL